MAVAEARQPEGNAVADKGKVNMTTTASAPSAGAFGGATIEKVDGDYSSRIQEMKEFHKQEILTLKSRHEKLLAAQQARYEAEIKALRLELEASKESEQQEGSRLMTDLSGEIQVDQLLQEIRDLKAKLAKFETETRFAQEQEEAVDEKPSFLKPDQDSRRNSGLAPKLQRQSLSVASAGPACILDRKRVPDGLEMPDEFGAWMEASGAEALKDPNPSMRTSISAAERRSVSRQQRKNILLEMEERAAAESLNSLPAVTRTDVEAIARGLSETSRGTGPAASHEQLLSSPRARATRSSTSRRSESARAHADVDTTMSPKNSQRNRQTVRSVAKVHRDIDPAQLDFLTSQGFSSEKAKEALESTNNDVMRALHVLNSGAVAV